jgi:hypothetical protein
MTNLALALDLEPSTLYRGNSGKGKEGYMVFMITLS